MPKPGSYKKIKRQPTQEDREFIRNLSNGDRKGQAFKKAYPNHPKVSRYMDIVKNDAPQEFDGERDKLNRTITQLAKDKVQAKYIHERLVSFQDSMDVLAAKSIYVANDLLENGRSEMVKADLAKEFIRHKVGSPTVKVTKHEEKVVTLTWGEPPKNDDMSDIIEAEVIE